MERRDDALAEAARQGDREAFAALVESHKEFVYRVLFRMVGSEHDAQDLAQEAFIKCYRSLAGYRQDSAFRTWLHRLTVNVGLDWLRAHRRRPLQVPLEEPMVESEGVEEAAIRHEQRERLLAAIRSLPADYREAVLLRHYHRLAYEEIAQRTGTPIRTVETRLYRAKAMLRDALGEGRERHGLPDSAPEAGRVLGG